MKTDALLKREERISKFLEDLKDTCARGEAFKFGVKGNEYGLSATKYKEVRSTYVKDTGMHKVFKWNTRKSIKTIAAEIAAPVSKAKVVKTTKFKPTKTVLETPKAIGKTFDNQMSMNFEEKSVKKIVKKMTPKAKVTIILKEVHGKSVRTVEHTVDASRFNLSDVESSIQNFVL